MTQPVARLLLAWLLVLAAGSARLEAQLPQPGTDPSTVPVRDPTVAPPLPSRNPRLTPQPAVQPGTILRDPAATPVPRQLGYAPAGEPPTGLHVTATEPRGVSIGWTAPQGASGYWVSRQSPGDTAFYSAAGLLTDPTATLVGLLPATRYSFRVTAVYPQEGYKRPGVSEPVAATTAAAPVPTGFTATVVGRGVVNVSWARLVGADGYRVSRNDITMMNITPMNYAGGTSLATSGIDSVMPGTYRYQVQAVYRDSNSKPAEVVSAWSQPVSVVIPASSRVRYCQTRAGRGRCAGAESPSVTIAAVRLIRTAGRTTP